MYTNLYLLRLVVFFVRGHRPKSGGLCIGHNIGCLGIGVLIARDTGYQNCHVLACKTAIARPLKIRGHWIMSTEYTDPSNARPEKLNHPAPNLQEHNILKEDLIQGIREQCI